ncbi:MAG TPA: SAM-dependent methyltransferase [Candidatus Nanoarchaeia archaeon]|nr:SAM-dependent methyltransferase [Candidatus Nanoarchaeia archaeon]
MPKFIIEHLETQMYPWCLLEYRHISKRVGRKNLMFTNVTTRDEGKLSGLGKVHDKSVKALKLAKACVLDPAAKKTLTPREASKYDFFIFGGILGDNPQRFRTKRKLSSKLKLPTYNLGDKQMSTDTAVIVCNLITRGIPLEKMKFQDDYEIEEEPGFYRILPYRYLMEKGKVVFTPGLKALLKKMGHKL